jgi:glycosyltransferase involved in cell wall biosynthesis/SAM-dependent methyltransferase
LLRLSELDRRLKQSSAAEGRDHEELIASRDGIAVLRREIAELRASHSWRLGNSMVRVLHAVGWPLTTALSPFLVVWRSRPAHHDRAYRRAVAAGSPLATVDATVETGATVRDAGPLSSLVNELRSVRVDGPRLLDPGERAELQRTLASTSGEPDLEDRLRHLLSLSDPIAPVRDLTSVGALVIDVRPLQLPIECGTKTHGEHVVRAVCSLIPEDGRVLMLASGTLPRLDPATAALFDGRFVPGSTPLESVSSFLQLTPFWDPGELFDAAFVRAPWVRRAVVWLDAIVGRYPARFLRDGASFVVYQLGIEKLGRADSILALSETSRAELPSNLDPRTTVYVTGSRPGLTSDDARLATITLPEDRYCLLIGNAFPHKNLAAGVVAFTRSQRARDTRMKLVVTALLDDAQRTTLRDLMTSTGGDANNIAFRSQLRKTDFARLIQSAEVVMIPSLHEGFSLPIIEALELATPVVASDIAAHRELLGADPALADPREPASLARALDDALIRRNETLTRQLRALSARYDPRRLERATAVLLYRDLSPVTPADPTTSRSDKDTPIGAPRRIGTDAERRGPLSQSKVCNVEDFAHPDLVDVLREHFAHEVARFGPHFPAGREWRKYWEVAMAMRTFARGGLLDQRHEFLGVGAGNEPTIFLLTRHAARVVATDLYLDAGWEENASVSMLTDPGWHWPFTWRPERLDLIPMSGLDLRFPDASFDAIFSSSSIEHFGDRIAIARAVDEMYRVLRPGGTLSISTEYRIAGPPPGMPGVEMFDAQDVDELFVGTRGWHLVDGFDPSISPRTLGTAADFTAVAADQQHQVDELGGYYTHLLEFETYPHIVLSRPPHLFTSFHLALRKER